MHKACVILQMNKSDIENIQNPKYFFEKGDHINIE